MNSIRKNDAEEITVFEAIFRFPKLYLFFYLLAIFPNIAGLILSIVYFFIPLISATLVIIAVILIVFALHFYAVKKNVCIITNKRIKGNACVFFGSFLSSSTYSYRLGEIDSVEIGSALGIHTLILVFAQGIGLRNVFRVSYISNYEEAYDKLTELLCSIKNDKDLYADIESKKIEAENRQVSALEKIANRNTEISAQPANSTDYITQLKGLKELLDAGIITQEEFDLKKKALLM